MDSKSKSNIDKSKSPRSGIVTKSDYLFNSKEQKKTLANKLMSKRRGVYVEKNPTKLTSDEAAVYKPNIQRISSPLNLRQSKFSTSILTSSFVGNRNLVTHEVIKTSKGFRDCNRSRNKKPVKQMLENNFINYNKINLAKSDKKVKSKTLNMQKNYEDLVFVFKSRNNMDHSATNSRNSDEKELPPGVQDDDVNTMRHILSKSACSGLDRVAAEVLQGRMKGKEKKWKAADDPETLVSDNKIDEHLYNLCVDLVDTTISTNDSKADHECVSSSKQEQDGLTSRSETVTKKIKFKEFDDMDPYEFNNNPTDKFYILENNDVLDLDLPNVLRFKHTKFVQKENLKTQSLIYPKRKKHLTQQSKSFNMPKSRQNAKNDFLNTIKRELQTYDNIIEEPRNMFEALKLIARNKIKSSKHIHFENTNHIKTGKAPNDPDCEFNSPKLIETKKLNRNVLKGNKFADRSPTQKRRIGKHRSQKRII